MKRIIQLIASGLLVSAAGAADLSTSAVLQIRSVLDAPSDESEQMSIISKTRNEVVNVQKAILLDQTALKTAEVHTDKLGHPQIEITFTDDGRKRFAAVTRENVGKRLAIVIDGQLYCAPTIRTEIAGGKAEINGSFTEQEAKDLAKKITEKIRK